MILEQLKSLRREIILKCNLDQQIRNVHQKLLNDAKTREKYSTKELHQDFRIYEHEYLIKVHEDALTKGLEQLVKVNLKIKEWNKSLPNSVFEPYQLHFVEQIFLDFLVFFGELFIVSTEIFFSFCPYFSLILTFFRIMNFFRKKLK